MEVKASFEFGCQQETRIQLCERHSVILNFCQAEGGCAHTAEPLQPYPSPKRTRGVCNPAADSPADTLHPLATRPTA